MAEQSKKMDTSEDKKCCKSHSRNKKCCKNKSTPQTTCETAHTDEGSICERCFTDTCEGYCHDEEDSYGEEIDDYEEDWGPFWHHHGRGGGRRRRGFSPFSPRGHHRFHPGHRFPHGGPFGRHGGPPCGPPPCSPSGPRGGPFGPQGHFRHFGPNWNFRHCDHHGFSRVHDVHQYTVDVYPFEAKDTTVNVEDGKLVIASKDDGKHQYIQKFALPEHDAAQKWMVEQEDTETCVLLLSRKKKSAEPEL